MKKHTRIYLDHFGYDESDFIPCEVCGARAVDVNHINARGMGGNPKGDKDRIENLMAVCRECHTKYGDQKVYKRMLTEIHTKKMNKCQK